MQLVLCGIKSAAWLYQKSVMITNVLMFTIVSMRQCKNALEI